MVQMIRGRLVSRSILGPISRSRGVIVHARLYVTGPGNEGIAEGRPVHIREDFLTKLSLSTSFRNWASSFKPNRLKEVQDELIELMIPRSRAENAHIERENKQVVIDSEGNFINEVVLKITNDPAYESKHLVFVHGYGASLGCFARNFQIINKFKDQKYNYEVHFLDNITFGLSSNPTIKSKDVNHWFIQKCPEIKIHDPEPTDKSKLYKKYYKLVNEFEINSDQFEKYQEHYKPILKEIETFYVEAIDGWRKASGIEKIDFLIGHSYGGYWSGSYAVRYPENLKNLILLSPVGVERHVHAVTSDLVEGVEETVKVKPELDPTSYRFLTRIPILSKNHERVWYYVMPFVPRFLKLLGPWGYRNYFKLWYPKLHKINKVIDNIGGPDKVKTNANDFIYGTNKECLLIIDYLYNSISNGSNSDIYIKNLLTPATVSKWPLYDKFDSFYKSKGHEQLFNVDLVYGQFDFMNSEAGEELVELINKNVDSSDVSAKFHTIRQGGHNLYIDNPFDTNKLIRDIVVSKSSMN